MPAKFKFGGHIRPFWVTDSTGRIRVTVTRPDFSNKEARSDIFYADDTTVGRVADAIQQALFGSADKAAEPGEEIVLTLTKSGVYSYHPGLTPEALPALRQIVGQLERRKAKTKANRQAYGGCQGCETRRAEEACPEEGGVEDPNRKGPAHSLEGGQ